MYSPQARNLRTAERFLLAPPLPATFGSAAVAVCDISAKGARFRHASHIETGSKSVLNLQMDDRPSPVMLEAVVVWTQADSGVPGQYLSGVRTYAPDDLVSGVLANLHTSKRSNRIEELRSTDRFLISPALEASFNGSDMLIEDLSARGARLDTAANIPAGTEGKLLFSLPGTPLEVQLRAVVAWCSMKSIKAATVRYHAGLAINEKPELLRLAIGQLSEVNRASLDTNSLRLKLRIMRARARQLAPSFRQIEQSGIPTEQYLLIQGVREELRLNPEEGFHWYRRARISIADPATRTVAPLIANHADALAVWEYLDRSVDASFVGRAFELPPS